MKKLFSFCLLLLFLFFIPSHQTNSFIALNTIDLIQETCEICADRSPILSYNFCVTSLQAVHQSHTANVQGLGIIALELALDNATDTVSSIEKLLKKETFDPYAMLCLEDCLELYSDAITRLRNSISAFLFEVYCDANVWVSAAMEATRTCEGGFKDQEGEVSPLTEKNSNLLFSCYVKVGGVHSSVYVDILPSLVSAHAIIAASEDTQEQNLPKDATVIAQLRFPGFYRWKWWILVALNTFFLLFGQSAGILLGRFYFAEGGNSKWMATLVQTAGFPILSLPLYLLNSSHDPSSTANCTRPSVTTLTLIYFFIGLIITGDNMMYSIGLMYISASTYSLLCASQLAFNAVFSFYLNSQKFTALIFNSIVLLTLSASLLAFSSNSSKPTGVSKGKYVIGFLCTVGASATYSLLLSLLQLCFQKVLKRENFSVVLEVQIYTSIVSTFACIVGLFASGEWRDLKGEMEGFGTGRVSYVMTLVWTAVAWQVFAVGIVGLVFVASSLFANVISTLSLAILPVAAVIFFHDKMDGVKVVAMLLAIWGFASYIYLDYLDDSKVKEKQTDGDGIEVP
ncbi:hypothetical protein HHK36_000477 [Tetracentron sinense]|uniref:Probable purine permease n=1 Tax=Tetracentron sinense TaxID=13715 RepID=A0A834ZRM7_TETSI|nr:hypothetical protein HHK36_000477 [Tetracentron sinense]